jgi:hypothetical protein
VNPDDGNVAWMFYYLSEYDQPGNAIYRSDNTLGNDNGRVIEEHNDNSYDPNVSSPPAGAPLPPGYQPMLSTVVEDFVLTNAGARPNDRDAVDTRLIEEVRSRTGRYLSTQDDAGGWPPLDTTARALALPSNPHKVTASGYTALEEWLHTYATSLEGDTSTKMSAEAPRDLHIIN